MSSKKNNHFIIANKGYAVYGYIRENFDTKCWIDEIVATIIQFYKIKGGSLYVCGDGVHGKLGIEKYKNNTCKIPTLCPPFTNNNALKVSVSYNHTLIVDTEGDVWCCGLGQDGQLGNGKTDDVYVPTKLNLKTRVIAVCAGLKHSLLLFDDGTVKGCGSNKWGQLGLGGLKKTLVPKTIETLIKYKVVQITGSNHSVALTEDGDLFCFGSNFRGQCGVGNGNEKKIMTPTKVDLDDEIEFVECGDYHTLIITRRGFIYSFGSGLQGKLGHGKEESKYVPTLIASLKGRRMTVCAAGWSHSLCVDKEGTIWSFGGNYQGQCGISEDIDEQRTPKMISWFIKKEIKVKECFAGYDQSSVIAFDGSLYLFGANDDYQLGLNEDKNYRTPTKLSISQNVAVQSVSMGTCITAMI